MSASQELDRLSNTFSADRSFCDHLLASANAPKVAELLVYDQWARAFLPQFQEALLTMVPRHFKAEHHEIVKLWTALLTGGIRRDISLIFYFVVRGLLSEAGSVLRRALEHASVLTHFWKEPSKAEVLGAPDSKGFMQAFQSERDQKTIDDLKKRRIKKRFASFSLAEPASLLYELLSEYNVHGGIATNLVHSPLEPSKLSCGFLNRQDAQEYKQLDLLVNGSEMILFEVVNIQATFGKPYGVTRVKLYEAGRELAELMNSPSAAKTRQVEEILALLHGKSASDRP